MSAVTVAERAEVASKGPVYRFGKMSLAIDQRCLTGPLGTLVLKPKPFAALERLMRRPGVLVQQTDLVAAIWANPDDEPSEVEVYVRQLVYELRKLIELLGCDGKRIVQNVPGEGYRLRGDLA